jgi:hypothetical protein
VFRVVAGYGWGSEEEAEPVEGGERRRPSDIRSHDEAGGPDRAGLGQAGGVATRPKGLFGLKNERKRKTGCRTILSNFSNKDLILKAEDSNTFKPNLNWNQNGIN